MPLNEFFITALSTLSTLILNSLNSYSDLFFIILFLLLYIFSADHITPLSVRDKEMARQELQHSTSFTIAISISNPWRPEYLLHSQPLLRMWSCHDRRREAACTCVHRRSDPIDPTNQALIRSSSRAPQVSARRGRSCESQGPAPCPPASSLAEFQTSGGRPSVHLPTYSGVPVFQRYEKELN